MRNGKIRRRRATLLTACAIAAAATPLFAHAQSADSARDPAQTSLRSLEDIAQEPELDIRIAEIRLRERQVLARDVLLYVDAEEELYAPFSLAMELLDFPVAVDATGKITGWFLREAQRLEIDPTAQTVSIAGSSSRLAPRQLVLIDGELHISVQALQDWLLLRPEWDPSRQILFLDPPYLLASEEAARRGSRDAFSLGFADIDTTGFIAVPQNYRWLDWPYVTANLSASTGSRDSTLVQGSLLAEGDLLKATGRLSIAADTQGFTNARLTLERRDPLARLLGPLKASVLEAGDLAAPPTPLLQRNAFGVGFRIGREPLEQGGDFDTTDLIGDAPAGWQAELYRDNELLGFQTVGPDGRYSFLEVPTFFGTNRFRIELYGPSGEQRRIERVVDIASSLVQPGQLQYNLLALREGLAVFDGTLNSQIEGQAVDPIFADPSQDTPSAELLERSATYLEARASYGVSSKLGINALAAWRDPDGNDPATANFGAGFALRTGGIQWGGDGLIQQNGEIAGRGRVGFALGAFNLTASHEHYSSGFRSDENDFGEVQIRSRSQVLVNGRLGGLGLGLTASRSVRASGGTDEQLGLRANGVISGISWSNRLSYRRNSSIGGLGDTVERGDGALLVAGPIGPFRLRAGIDYELLPKIRARRITGEVNYRASDWFLSFRAERDLREGAGRWGLAVNRDWNGIRLGADLRYDDSNSDWRGFLTLAFAFDRDPMNGTMRFGRSALSNRGSLRASAFLDANANGSRDAGEDSVPGVAFDVAPRGRTTNQADFQLFENLPVDRQIAVSPRLRDVDNPYLVPLQPGFLVTTRAGNEIELDLPLVESGEIAVTLVGSDGKPLADTVLAVMACSGGPAVQRERTAFDGAAFFTGLLPGCYIVKAGEAEMRVEVLAGEFVEQRLSVGGGRLARPATRPPG